MRDPFNNGARTMTHGGYAAVVAIAAISGMGASANEIRRIDTDQTAALEDQERRSKPTDQAVEQQIRSLIAGLDSPSFASRKQANRDLVSRGKVAIPYLVEALGEKSSEVRLRAHLLLTDYHDFEDVLVPLELQVDKGKSFVYHAPGFKAGIISLSGRVEVESLIRFFENQMAKDNWRLMSVFKAPRTIMFFNKPNRSCIIIITEKQFKTEVDVCVVPTMEEEESALLN